MTHEEFMIVVNDQLETCKKMLGIKQQDYNDSPCDRLDGFKKAASLQNCKTKQSLAGMMAKHTTSIYDMCESEEHYSVEKWEEKITDHINYLLLLRAIIEEETTYDGSKPSLS